MKSYTATGSLSFQLLNPVLYTRQELEVTLHSRYNTPYYTILYYILLYWMYQLCWHILYWLFYVFSLGNFLWENVGKFSLCAVQTYWEHVAHYIWRPIGLFISDLWLLSIYTNALNRSNNRDLSTHTYLVLNYHLITIVFTNYIVK